ncbi:polysaccharide lyase family 8 super-sandwich domain-containing protein [Maribacter sp. TH_r10]|uniref:polysaccharide lyase family 8 super-sandwich domain-containing protein n=1 Tax=Maribacter sp. TH_r10 TaxID=3082086 RepID=UPI0029539991|nr:polysaccharide lyase family 8 super-sandwich domain-containing protein [Maribacter sp. TH_r10]MDV7140424.1 polysaccharide lyase family 8 super-sandwich domain-containing protein [Maribacter sp. TH_r10]
MKKWILIIAMVICHQTIFSNDLDKLKQNVRDFYLLEKVSNAEVAHLLEGMKGDFSFGDIDYDMHRRSNWKPREHLKRLIKLAIAYEDVNSDYYQQDHLAEAIVGGLNYWSYHDFYSDNWWHQEIGVPQSIGPTLIICEKIIPDSTMVRSLKVMDKSKIKMTGQNKIWLSGNVFMRELVRGNRDLMTAAADTIKSVVVPSKPYEEGIQPDYSFHQHGPQPQLGNYGLHFAEDIVKWMFIFDKTGIAFSSEKVDLMRNFMFQAQQKVNYKGKYELLATGRQLFPERVNGEKYRGPKSKYDLYKNLERIFNLFDSHENPTGPPKEYVHFRNSDYSLYRTNGFFSPVRMSSQRVIGAEAGNGENLMGYHLGDGTNLIYRRGDEYHEIYPVWNWRKLPGTTTVQDTVPLPVLTWSGYRNGSHFTGGLQSDWGGISAFEYRRDSLKANKSYFFKDNTVYALGSAIGTDRDFEVVTTINQCYKKGPVIINKKKGKITSVWHDSIAYVNLGKQQLKVQQGIQTGNWKKILTWQTDTLISKEVFDLEVDHGIRPKNAKYAYVSIVGVSEKEAEKAIKKELGRILVHSGAVHALSFDQGKNIAISAFKPSEVPIGHKQQLKINSPCLLNLYKLERGWKIEAVDPTQMLEKLSFGISGKYKVKGSQVSKIDGNVTYFEITLPSENDNKGMKASVILMLE